MQSLDLVAWTAQHAPAWLRVVISVFVLLWTIATSVTLFLRGVPEERFTKLEAAWPAGARFFRALRKLGTDWVPFLKELALAVVTGLVRGPRPPAGPTLVLLVMVACGGAAVGCKNLPTQTVVTAGVGVATLHRLHQRAYVRATDELRLSLADGGTLRDYNRLVEPITAEFRARGEAIYALDGYAYAAATVIDAVRRGAPLPADAGATSWRDAAGQILAALARTIPVVTTGVYLPRLEIPPEVTAAVAALQAIITGGGPDGGA